MKLFLYVYFLCQPVNFLMIELSYLWTVKLSALSDVTRKFYEDFVVAMVRDLFESLLHLKGLHRELTLDLGDKSFTDFSS